MAASFRTSSILLDPSGRLTELQMAVSIDHAKRQWVHRRCEHAESNILRHLRGVTPSHPFHDQVAAWLFALGVTTHVLLVAGLKNPTVRKRYVAVQELLADYGYLAFHEKLLDLLGCAGMTRQRGEHHLVALTKVFDQTKAAIRTPFFFASDISDSARPIAIDGSRELIERGTHREAIFRIVATYSRCQKVLVCDAPVEVQDRFSPGYRMLLSDLDVSSFADLEERRGRTVDFLPQLREVAEIIVAHNSGIED
jgi:hypothetical protein